MNLAQIAIDNRAVTYFVCGLLVIGGIASFGSLGQLEDPEFTVKTASIVTPYPGASPEEVELEVTDLLEQAIQELSEVDYIESISRAGLSIVKVEIKPEYWSDRLPEVWDKLRRKIRDVEASLPPGAGRPDVGDDFGQVFGFQLAVIGDGFNYAELETYAKELRRELSVVEGVARVDLWGVQDKVIYLETSETQLSQLGITDTSLARTLNDQNLVVDAGSLDLQDRRFRIAPTGEFKSPQDIADLTVRASLLDEISNLTSTVSAATGGAGAPVSRSGELIRIRDIGNVVRGYRDPPTTLMRYNGRPAIGVSITNVSGVNTVDVGRRIDERLEELMEMLPIGIEVSRVHWMSDIVDAAVQGFLINFAEAVAIVLVVLTLAMGWRMGVVIGTALIATILGSLILMAIFGIDLQRMSLGALVIALGMMVDNAIVVADGYVVRTGRGMDKVKAALESASLPATPLLGATVVAVMAFYPIFASVEGAGEYCRTLFTVVAISLLTSWVISMTLTPLQCIDMLPVKASAEGDADPYGSSFFTIYRRLLEFAIRSRILTIVAMLALLVAAGIGFGNVKQLFFPDSSMTKFMVDFWTPEGTRIQNVSGDLAIAEQKFLADERIVNVASFIGAGPPRFYLPVEPELPYQSYGQLIVNVKDFRDIDQIIDDFRPWFAERFPQAQTALRKYGVGPSNTWKFEVRVSGPASADPAVLREFAFKGIEILQRNPMAGALASDWRQRVRKVVPEFNEERARWAALSRDAIAAATKRAFDGQQIGVYRERDDLIPIVLRHVEAERQHVGGLDALQVRPPASAKSIPLAQVTDGVHIQWEDPIIWRRDRRRTITIQTNPVIGVTLPELRSDVLAEFEEFERQLPRGYKMEWGGEYEDTRDSQQSLIPGAVPALAIIAFIVVALFNAFKPPLVIVCTIPFAAIGITIGLLTFSVPFGFLALLGAMSLIGMMIKNAIVLLDEININLAAGKPPYQSVIDSGLSRLRPVVLAAATTVLGVIPLLQDVFWIGMAVTVMAGLTFGTILTMIMVPVFYATFYKIPSPA